MNNNKDLLAALDALKSHIAILDEQGIILAVNRAWREFARANGANPELVSEGVNYLNVCDSASGEDAELARQAASAIRAVLSGEQADATFEYPCHSPQEPRWFYCHISPLGETGARRVVIQHENSTAQRKEAAGKTFYFNALNASVNEIYILDAETLRFEFVSEGACRNLGYSLSQLRAMTPLNIKPDYTAESLESLLAPLRQKQVNDLAFETTHRRANGSQYPVDVRIQMFEQSGRQVFVAVILDISERKQAEAQLRLANAALESAGNAMVITDHEGKIEWLNPAFSSLTGYSRSEAIGKTPGSLIKSGRQTAAFYKQFWDTLRAGKIWHGDIINCRKDNTLYHEEMTVTPIIDEQGQTLHFIAIKQDITERKRIERELEKHAARLAIINDLGQKISGVLELQGVLELTARLVHDTFDLYHVALFIFDEGRNELVMRARAGRFADLFPSNYRIKLGSGMVGFVAQSGKKLLANDVGQEPHYINFYPDRQRTASEISLPLRIGEQVLGVMDAQSPEVNAFSEEDVAALEILADQVAVAIENSRLYETAQQELEERKHAEASLRQAEQRYRALFENSPISLWEEDCSALKQRLDELKAEGIDDFPSYLKANPSAIRELLSLIKILDVSDTAVSMYGAKSKNEFFGSLARLVNDSAIEQYADEISLIAQGSLSFSMEFVDKTLDNRRIDIVLNWSVLPGFEETLEKVIVSIADITERRRAERKLQEYRANLEKIVAERTAELVIARDQAEAASRAKSDFLAVMSHEIRTPLNGVLGLTHLMQQTPLNEKQKNYLTRLQFSGETLLSIINDILDFSKIEAGNMQLEHAEFNLDDMLRNLSSLLAYRAQEKGLELLFDTAPGVPRFLVGDPLRLGQVLSNLVGNAIKFTERGEVVLKITTSEQTAQHVRLDFSARDTGVGIPKEQAARLFQPFTQADTSITRKYGGTGLGLTISQRLVRLMGGNIEVESQAGKGSTFRFSLNIEKQRKLPQTRPLYAEALRGLRVLLIGDHPATLEYLKNALESFSFEVTAAPSAAAGLELLENSSGPCRLVIIDLSIAGETSGLQAARAIRQANASNHIPIILLLSAEEMLYQDENATLDGYLVKPVTRSQLFDMVMQVFGQQASPAHPPRLDIDNSGDLRALQGKHILLVEDNEINQVVANEMLKSLGLQVTVASSGEEGLWMLKNGRFDAALMDIQMPGMDGYQTTAQIRGDERFTFTRLPIIAMTAHALDGDREKALEAGLNDYVSKPIDINRLTAALLRWLKPQTSSAQGLEEQARPLPPEQRDALLPEELRAHLDTPSALARLGGSQALYRRLLQMFHAENASAAQNIRRALQTGSLEEARRLAHTLKGVAATIGAAELAESAKELESAITQNEVEKIEPCLEQVEKRLSKIRSAIANAEKSVQLSKSHSISPEDLAPRLRQLMRLLNESDAEAVDLAENIHAALQGTERQEEFSGALRQIRHYDFSGALQTLSSKWNVLLHAEKLED